MNHFMINYCTKNFRYFSFVFIFILGNYWANAQENIQVKIEKSSGPVYFLECINGFGGGNVAASIGPDGILLVDDMYASVATQLDSALKTISQKPIRIVLNTHFHGDHIQGNLILRNKAVLVGHTNLAKRLIQNNKESAPTLDLVPAIQFSDSLTIDFNGEAIKIRHYPNCHTDGDAVIYFSKSKVLHLGDMYFAGMFPAVYTEGGGNIRNLILTLESIARDMPADVKVIPGHGPQTNLNEFKEYISMLSESVRIIDAAINKNMSLEKIQEAKLLGKYDALGQGGAQTTTQYTAMLYRLLSPKR